MPILHNLTTAGRWGTTCRWSTEVSVDNPSEVRRISSGDRYFFQCWGFCFWNMYQTPTTAAGLSSSFKDNTKYTSNCCVRNLAVCGNLVSSRKHSRYRFENSTVEHTCIGLFLQVSPWFSFSGMCIRDRCKSKINNTESMGQEKVWTKMGTSDSRSYKHMIVYEG